MISMPTIEKWSKTLNVGPFFVIEHAEQDCLYRGQPSKLEMAVGMVQSGPINIEFVQQLNDTPSVYRDIYQPGEEGFHHVSMFTDNYDEEIERYQSLGYEVGLEGDMGVYRYCYVDTFSVLGFMVELVEDKPAIQATYKKVRDAAEGWDGTDLIRPLL